LYAANGPRGTRSRAGRIFYNEFQSRFWEEPSKYKEFITKLNIFYICLMLTNFYFLVNQHQIRKNAVAVTQHRRDVRGKFR
jgi:hypothetical protein